MNDCIRNDGQLNAYARGIAEDILADLEPGAEIDEAQERVHEHVDGDQNVIYYARAHSICQNCDVSEGEAFIEDVGNPSEPTYDSIAAAIAYGELCYRVTSQLAEIIADRSDDDE